MDIDSVGPVVLETLTNACSQDPQVLNPAEHQLQQWQIQPGFYTILASIFCNHEIDINVRWMAVMYIKNGVDKYWRRTAPKLIIFLGVLLQKYFSAMREEEKEVIRQRLLVNFNEPSPQKCSWGLKCQLSNTGPLGPLISLSKHTNAEHQICTQMAVLIAKIARLDCPRHWPTLLPTLLQTVRCDNQLLQERSLLVLHHVVKTLASKRLSSDRKLFEELTLEIFGYIYGLWMDYLAEFLRLATVHSEEMLVFVDRAILSLRILRRLVTFGFRDPAENQEAMSFLNDVFIKLDAMLECRRSLWGDHKMLEKCEKMINILTKVLLDSLEQHPVCFMQFINRTLEFVVRYNFSQHGLLFERFTVNCFNLMKDILLCDTYRLGKHEGGVSKCVTVWEWVKNASKNGPSVKLMFQKEIGTSRDPDSVKVQACKIKTNFFTFPTLSEVCHRLVSQYFLLTNEDLTHWDTDPEEFCQEEVGDTYKYSLRPCTETLFLSLFKEYRMSLSSVLLKMVEVTQTQFSEDNMPAILRKDAVYNAVGLAAFDLFDEIDFDQWFSTQLREELNNKHVNYRIIRRRVIWLLGQWVGVKLSSSLRPMLYEAILPLLQHDEDLVVRLEAANTLKLAVDDFEFKVEQFLPYLEASFSLLFQLLKEVQQCDTKMQILHVISFVIERVGGQIRPYASSLITYLPTLWEESKDHNMLRCAILTTLIHLVQGFGNLSSAMYSFLLPIIEMSTDTNQPQHVYLMEDGLELWHVTLLNAEKITPQLINLYKNMPDLLDGSTENLRLCLKVIEAYVYLGPQEFMEAYSEELVQSFTSLLTDLRTEGVVLILRNIELVFKSFPTEGPAVFKSMLPAFLQEILNKDEHPVVMSLYLTLFGRVVLQNQKFFWSFLDQMAADNNTQSEVIFNSLLLRWIESIDLMTQPERRKLAALAMASLFTVNSSVVLEQFGQIVNVCVQVLHDVCRVPVDEETVIQLDALVISDGDQLGEDELETEHEKRKRSVTRKDPVHSIPLKDFVFQQLQQCHNLHGDAVFDKLTKQIDPEVFNQLQQFTKT